MCDAAAPLCGVSSVDPQITLVRRHPHIHSCAPSTSPCAYSTPPSTSTEHSSISLHALHNRSPANLARSSLRCRSTTPHSLSHFTYHLTAITAATALRLYHSLGEKAVVGSVSLTSESATAHTLPIIVCDTPPRVRSAIRSGRTPHPHPLLVCGVTTTAPRSGWRVSPITAHAAPTRAPSQSTISLTIKRTLLGAPSSLQYRASPGTLLVRQQPQNQTSPAAIVRRSDCRQGFEFCCCCC